MKTFTIAYIAGLGDFLDSEHIKWSSSFYDGSFINITLPGHVTNVLELAWELGRGFEIWKQENGL